MKISMTGQEKSDLLIQVTKSAGVTVFEFGVTSIKQPLVFKGHLFVVPMVTS